jgi:hypothetical protein
MVPGAWAALAALVAAGRGEFEYRMAVRLGDELFYRGVFARLEVWPGGGGDTDVTLEDGPGLCGETSRMV